METYQHTRVLRFESSRWDAHLSDLTPTHSLLPFALRPNICLYRLVVSVANLETNANLCMGLPALIIAFLTWLEPRIA